MADILQKIKTCREFLCGECEYDELRRAKGETVCMQKLLDDAADALERKKGKWIPVTERLPPEGKYVLAYGKELYPNPNASQMAVSKVCDVNYWSGFGRTWKITHWMTLPEPPKEET